MTCVAGVLVAAARSGRSSAWLERYVRDVEVARSNRVAPTLLYFAPERPLQRSLTLVSLPVSNVGRRNLVPGTMSFGGMMSFFTFVKSQIPYRFKAPLGRLLASRKSLAEDQRLNRRPCSLENRHLEGCRVLPNRMALLELLPKDGVVAEVGVANGDFSAAILDRNHPRTLHLIDLWASSFSGSDDLAFKSVSKRFANEVREDRVQFHRDYSWDAISKLAPASLDWIYIDAGHDYDDVVKDLEVARHAIKPDGFITGHDYVKWSSPNGRFGVVEAVNEFCLKHDFAMKYVTFESNMHHSFAIQRIS